MFLCLWENLYFYVYGRPMPNSGRLSWCDNDDDDNDTLVGLPQFMNTLKTLINLSYYQLWKVHCYT